MNEINEIKIPKGVDRVSVTQHDNKVVIEFIPEKPRFKDGDFVYEDGRIMIVKRYPNNYHANAYPEYSDDVRYNSWYGVGFSEQTFRYATEEEKNLLIDAMKKDGKRWNAEKLEIEDITQLKFKAGDKVTLKSGCCTSNSSLIYHSKFDEYIGKKLIVIDYTKSGNIECNNGFYFAEDWLEPWSDEPKNGDLAIFWDYSKDIAIMRTYREKKGMLHYDSVGYPWKNAIKFESKEQFKKVLRGEI